MEQIMKARFHLPDFSGNFKLNLLFADMLEKRPDFFREGVEIASFYGVFPPCLWNGGRPQGGMTDKNFIKAVIKTFNDRGIPLRYTFTNLMLEKKHLSDDRIEKGVVVTKYGHVTGPLANIDCYEAGLPIVVSNTTFVSTIVIDGVTGFVYDDANELNLDKAILHYTEDLTSSEKIEMRKRCVTMAMKYDNSTVIDTLTHFLASIKVSK